MYNRFTGEVLKKAPLWQTNVCLRERVSQKFSKDVDEYALAVNKLAIKKIGIIDRDELIQSNKDCALSVIYEKFLLAPQVYSKYIDNNTIGMFYDVGEVKDDLLELGEVIQVADDYREKYNFSADMSVVDIYNHVNQINLDLIKSEKVDFIKKKYSRKKKEVNSNEVPQKVQEVVPETKSTFNEEK